MTRRFIIDTDTASDDAVALIMALREKSVHVEAITVVAGNVGIDLAVKNALISVEQARTYAPPVYRGIAKPMMRELFTAEFVHGSDGMGEMNLPEPGSAEQSVHAVDAIIELIMKHPGEIELVTLGPLTNIAVACLKEPRIASNVKHVYIMGTGGLGQGNVTPAAEFNIYVDAEAASIVFQSGMPMTVVGWDASMDGTFITQEDIDYLLAQKSEIADFCVRCNESLKQFNFKRLGKVGFDLPDPTTMAVAIHPEICTGYVDLYAHVEYKSEAMYGHVLMDAMGVARQPANIRLCTSLDAKKFKDYLFRQII
jgi:purine nucleosidase